MLPPRTILMVFALCMLGIGTLGGKYLEQQATTTPAAAKSPTHIDVSEQRLELISVRDDLENNLLPIGTLLLLEDGRIVRVCSWPETHLAYGLGAQEAVNYSCERVSADTTNAIWVIRPDREIYSEIFAKFTANERIASD